MKSYTRKMGALVGHQATSSANCVDLLMMASEEGIG